jgi:hypothetical protein
VITRQVKATSADVTGVPSCQVGPSRRRIVYTRPSAEMPPLATVGTSAASTGR